MADWGVCLSGTGPEEPWSTECLAGGRPSSLQLSLNQPGRSQPREAKRNEPRGAWKPPPSGSLLIPYFFQRTVTLFDPKLQMNIHYFSASSRSFSLLPSRGYMASDAQTHLRVRVSTHCFSSNPSRFEFGQR